MEIVDLSNNFIECVICFYPVLNDKYVTDCSHTFHHICLYEWYQQKNVCPLCTKEIVIEQFNQKNTDDSDMELRYTGLAESGLIDTIEYQRYLEYIERQRHSREQRELENLQIEETGQHSDSTIVIFNDYNALVSDEEDSHSDSDIVISPREKIKMRVYIFLEFTISLTLITYILNVLQLSILILCISTSVTYKMQFTDMQFLSLFFKIIFIIYYFILTHMTYYGEMFIFVPWIAISLVK